MPSGIPATAKVTATRIMYILGLLLFLETVEGKALGLGLRVLIWGYWLRIYVLGAFGWGLES